MAASSSVGGAEDNDEESESEGAMLEVMGEVMRRSKLGDRAGSRHVGTGQVACARRAMI